jgi:hypothetical protein
VKHFVCFPSVLAESFLLNKIVTDVFATVECKFTIQYSTEEPLGFGPIDYRCADKKNKVGVLRGDIGTIR